MRVAGADVVDDPEFREAVERDDGDGNEEHEPARVAEGGRIGHSVCRVQWWAGLGKQVLPLRGRMTN